MKCSVCKNIVNISHTFIPQICLIKYGPILSHRICHDCWWNPINGFGLERVCHKCPGCKDNMDYNIINKNEYIIIDE